MELRYRFRDVTFSRDGDVFIVTTGKQVMKNTNPREAAVTFGAEVEQRLINEVMNGLVGEYDRVSGKKIKEG